MEKNVGIGEQKRFSNGTSCLVCCAIWSVDCPLRPAAAVSAATTCGLGHQMPFRFTGSSNSLLLVLFSPPPHAGGSRAAAAAGLNVLAASSLA